MCGAISRMSRCRRNTRRHCSRRSQRRHQADRKPQVAGRTLVKGVVRGTWDDGGWEAGPESHVDCRKRTFIAFQSARKPDRNCLTIPGSPRHQCRHFAFSQLLPTGGLRSLVVQLKSHLVACSTLHPHPPHSTIKE